MERYPQTAEFTLIYDVPARVSKISVPSSYSVFMYCIVGCDVSGAPLPDAPLAATLTLSETLIALLRTVTAPEYSPGHLAACCVPTQPAS